MNNNKEFIVIIGGDGAGKSTILQNIHIEGWKVVSYSPNDIPIEYESLSDIAKTIRERAIPKFNVYGTEFRTAYYHLFVAYLNEIIEKTLQESNVICDSYYYKFLAKEKITSGGSTLHGIWRNLRKPDRVIYLKVPASKAFRRVIQSRSLQSNEYFISNDNEHSGFVKFQNKLCKEMLRECKAVPIEVIDASRSIEEVINDISKKLK